MKARAKLPSHVSLPFWLLLALAASVGATGTVAAAEEWNRSIDFSGYRWRVKSSETPVGPGPNVFADGQDSVWVDPKGHLHLRIRPDPDGRWRTAEVALDESLGYGAYEWTLGAVDRLDRNVVAGFFTWSDDAPEQHYREIDIEISRWGDPANRNAQYVVQPYQMEGNIERFDLPAGLEGSLHRFRWEPGRVTCLSKALGDQGQIVHTHTFTHWVPTPGGEVARINLWLINGEAPSDGRAAEIVVQGFRFVPL